MSTCISREGEYSGHELDAEFTCTRCGEFDQDACLATLAKVRASADEWWRLYDAELKRHPDAGIRYEEGERGRAPQPSPSRPSTAPAAPPPGPAGSSTGAPGTSRDDDRRVWLSWPGHAVAIDDIRVHSVEPGDVLAVRTHQLITAEQAKRIADSLSVKFGVPVVILSGEFDLDVIRHEEATR